MLATFTAQAKDFKSFSASLIDKTTGGMLFNFNPTYSDDKLSLTGGGKVLGLSKDHTYEILVSGQAALNSSDRYSGSIAVSAVPEAEEWAMMLLGLGMMGVVASRKKAA